MVTLQSVQGYPGLTHSY